MTRLHLTWSLERSPVKFRLSRVPWSRSPRAPPIGASYTGALLAALSVGSSAGCTRCTALRSDNSAALRQARAQTHQYCNPIPGSPLWVLALGTRSLLSCGPGSLGFPGRAVLALLRSVPPTLAPPCGALDRFLGRVYSTYSLALLWRCC